MSDSATPYFDTEEEHPPASPPQGTPLRALNFDSNHPSNDPNGTSGTRTTPIPPDQYRMVQSAATTIDTSMDHDSENLFMTPLPFARTGAGSPGPGITSSNTAPPQSTQQPQVDHPDHAAGTTLEPRHDSNEFTASPATADDEMRTTESEPVQRLHEQQHPFPLLPPPSQPPVERAQMPPRINHPPLSPETGQPQQQEQQAPRRHNVRIHSVMMGQEGQPTNQHMSSSPVQSETNPQQQQPDREQEERRRMREEQRRVLLLAAERRAAGRYGWNNSSSSSLVPHSEPPSPAFTTPAGTPGDAPQEAIVDAGAGGTGILAMEGSDGSIVAAVEGAFHERDLDPNAAIEGSVNQRLDEDPSVATQGASNEENVDSSVAATPPDSMRQHVAGTVRHITIQSNLGGQGITIIRNSDGGQQVLMPRQPGVTHRTIRVPPGTRQFTVPVGTGNNIRIQGAISAQQQANPNNNNPNVIPRVAIPPLMAQVIPTGIRTAPDGSDEEENQHDKYRCTICYEFFVDPSSCGKCASRFCHACLVRVANTRSSNNPTSSKCPACRAILTIDDIVRDEALREELTTANLQILCSFRGCEQRLPSALMKEHELFCDFTPMRCKNAIMGCPWNGLRKGLAHHLSHHCHFERIAGFVDQYRHTHSDHQAAIIALQRSQTMSNQLAEVNAGLMRRSLPSPTNVFDLLNLTYTACCTTAYFLFTADIWRLFLVQQGAQESRAMVCNLLYMLPTIFNVCRTAVGGYRLLLSLNPDQDIQLWVDNMELGVLSITPFLLLLTTGLCFLMDGQSSMTWSQYKYFGLWERKVLRDLATIAMLLINVGVIECDDAGAAAVFLWMCVLTATCCFPPIVLTVLGLASGISEPNPHQIFCAGRSVSVILFSLRYAAVAAFLGGFAAIDGAIIVQLLRRNLTFVVRYDLVPVSDGIWSSIGSEYLTGFLAVRFSMWAIDTRFEEVPWLTIFASVAFPLINFLIHQMTLLGIKIGMLVFREGRSNLLPNQLGVRNAFSVYGTLAFCIWSSLLLVLAVTF